MTCRHRDGDPSCSSHPDNVAARQREYDEEQRHKSYMATITPDKAKYEIEELQQVGPHLVLKVRYPNCTRCAFEGNKIMVFLGITVERVVFWKEIDPHFRDPTKQPPKHQAPRVGRTPSPTRK